MSFDFSLNKKQMALLVAASVALAILIFLAGLLVGKMTRPSASSASSPARSGGGVSGGQSVSSARTALTPQAMMNKARTAATGKAASRSEGQPGQAAVPSETEQSSAETAQKDAEDKPGPAEPPADAQETGESPESGIRFSVEVESFVAKSKAMKMAENLLARGWGQSCVLEIRDPEDKNNVWYSVQIGDYEHLDEAYDAASKFEKDEEIVAVVRSVDTTVLEKRKVSGK